MSRGEFKQHFNKGRQLALKRQFTAAIAEFEQALRHKPGDADTIFQLGNVSKAMGLFDVAIKWYDVALNLKPTSVEISFNRALALQQAGRNQDALDAYSLLEPSMQKEPMYWNNLGILLQQMGESLKAVAALERAVALKPNYFEAWNNLGLSYYICRRPTWPEAFQKAERQFKGDPAFHVNRATCHFQAGNYAEGWADYAFRHDPKFRSSVIYHHTLPRWHGEDLAGKTLLVGEEQGVGDQITFLSVLPEVSAQAGKVILEVNPKLVPLISRNFPHVTVVAPEQETIDLKRHHHYGWLKGPVDYFTPAGDMFHLMRPDLNSYPSNRAFLTSDPALKAKWHARLKKLGDRPKIGLSWRSSLVTGERQGAYLQFADLLQWIEATDQFQFINIQYGDCALELAAARGRDGQPLVTHFDDLDLFDDIEGTCALLDSLDMVLTVRNTQACLAGALGVKTVSYYGSHFQFGLYHTDPVYPSVLVTYPTPKLPPVPEQFETALKDFDGSYVRWTKASGEYDRLAARKHFLTQ